VEARARGTFYEDLPGFARKENEIKEWKKDELRRQQKKNTGNRSCYSRRIYFYNTSGPNISLYQEWSHFSRHFIALLINVHLVDAIIKWAIERALKTVSSFFHLSNIKREKKRVPCIGRRVTYIYERNVRVVYEEGRVCINDRFVERKKRQS
jgi:hypothetical protein